MTAIDEIQAVTTHEILTVVVSVRREDPTGHKPFAEYLFGEEFLWSGPLDPRVVAKDENFLSSCVFRFERRLRVKVTGGVGEKEFGPRVKTFCLEKSVHCFPDGRLLSRNEAEQLTPPKRSIRRARWGYVLQDFPKATRFVLLKDGKTLFPFETGDFVFSEY